MSLINVNLMADSQGGSVAPISSVMRNRIINGAMVIDQRNAGASVVFGTGSLFPVDRFRTYNTVGSGSTVQRSTIAPSGFSNSIVFTVGTGASPSAADECIFFQAIEGFNVADLGFGTASASSVTISFQVRSSVTGTYAFNLRNQAGNRSYVATYTINAANTYETKSITIPGDTSGTWATDNSLGILLRFDLGGGSNYNTTAGAWQNGNFTRTSGSVNWIANSGATFYITGVQLEKGTQATGFEYRQIGAELQLCQRYYQLADGYGGSSYSANNFVGNVKFVTTMRASPTVGQTGVNTITYPGNADYTQSSINISINGTTRVSNGAVQINLGNFSGITTNVTNLHNVGSGSITLSAEL